MEYDKLVTNLRHAILAKNKKAIRDTHFTIMDSIGNHEISIDNVYSTPLDFAAHRDPSGDLFNHLWDLGYRRQTTRCPSDYDIAIKHFVTRKKGFSTVKLPIRSRESGVCEIDIMRNGQPITPDEFSHFLDDLINNGVNIHAFDRPDTTTTLRYQYRIHVLIRLNMKFIPYTPYAAATMINYCTISDTHLEAVKDIPEVFYHLVRGNLTESAVLWIARNKPDESEDFMQLSHLIREAELTNERANTIKNTALVIELRNLHIKLEEMKNEIIRKLMWSKYPLRNTTAQTDNE